MLFLSLHGSDDEPDDQHQYDGDDQSCDEALAVIRGSTLTCGVGATVSITLLNKDRVEHLEAHIEEHPHQEDGSEYGPKHTLLVGIGRGDGNIRSKNHGLRHFNK